MLGQEIHGHHPPAPRHASGPFLLSEGSEPGKSRASRITAIPGSCPQTREAAILMLADSVEASSRTLTGSYARADQKPYRHYYQGYFFRKGRIESELTFKDLHFLSENPAYPDGIFHQRIAYPEAKIKDVTRPTRAGRRPSLRRQDPVLRQKRRAACSPRRGTPWSARCQDAQNRDRPPGNPGDRAAVRQRKLRPWPWRKSICKPRDARSGCGYCPITPLMPGCCS